MDLAHWFIDVDHGMTQRDAWLQHLDRDFRNAVCSSMDWPNLLGSGKSYYIMKDGVCQSISLCVETVY